MDWTFAIERNREALRRILAMLVGMAGLAGEGVPTLPRHLHRAILRLLRPAESATRRLVIVMARGMVVELPPLRHRKAKPTSLARPGGTGIIMPSGSLSPIRRRTFSLPLLDPLRSPLSKGPRPRHRPQSSIPRISFPGVTALSPITPRRPPSPDDRLDATRLTQRLGALGAALDDLPRQARRFARWKARKEIGRTRRAWPLRPGRPPGQRAPRRRNHEIHEILSDLHGLAFDVLERRDTS